MGLTKLSDFNTSMILKTGSTVALVLFLGTILIAESSFTGKTAAQKRNAISPRSSLTVQTEPNTTIWIDEIRRGVTDASGRLELKNISPGRHLLRVRATGFKEASS